MKHSLPLRSSCLLLCVLLAPVALAGPPEPSAPPSRQVIASPVEPGAVRLDGVLDEEVWSRARFTSDFFQKEPAQGAPASERTEVAVLFDREALYVGARMFSDEPERISLLMTRQDDTGQAEQFIVSLDTYRDRRTAYSFAVTAPGVRADWYHPEDDEGARDGSFNPVWEARTRVDARGWTAELRIPFSQLRFNPAAEQHWGINFNRYVPTRNEDAFWIYVPRERTGWASWFGELVGIRDVRPTRRLELVPYAAAGARLETLEPSPFPPPHPLQARVGMDAKMGLGPGLTLEGTINPDFGQVEADPAEVNLSAFETFFDERRPFFSEGSQLLMGRGPAYFYSRRIGAAPRLRPDTTDFVPPGSTTILGAAKLTGTVAPGVAVGALGAVTNESWASAYDTGDAAPHRERVEPFTTYGVARVQRQLGPEGSVVRASVAGVGRLIHEGEGLVEQLPRTALSGGLDWDLRLGGGEYALVGWAGGSHVAGLPAALTRLQESSAHYFQRPDQDYVRVDPEARSMAGYTGALKLARLSGEHWLWEAGVATQSPGLELNDLGRLSRADTRDVLGSVRYRETNPGTVWRRYEAALSLASGWDYGGTWQAASALLELNATWPNFWSSRLSFGYRPSTLSPTLTRGGPLMATGRELSVGGSLSNNFSERHRWTVEGTYSRESLGGEALRLLGNLTLQPTERLRLTFTPILDLSTLSRQYVDTLAGGPAETYGRRYVFSFLERSQLSAQLRASYYFSPALSLELYAEPFAASGRSHDFGQLAAAGRSDLRFYGGEEGGSVSRTGDEVLVSTPDGAFSLRAPDFNVRSLRSNLVLRWEWRRGSTLYVVWQQDRYVSRETGARVGPGALLEALRAPGSHALAVKLSYWLPVD